MKKVTPELIANIVSSLENEKISDEMRDILSRLHKFGASINVSGDGEDYTVEVPPVDTNSPSLCSRALYLLENRDSIIQRWKEYHEEWVASDRLYGGNTPFNVNAIFIIEELQKADPDICIRITDRHTFVVNNRWELTTGNRWRALKKKTWYRCKSPRHFVETYVVK